jgi:peroxiredoxin
MTSDLHALPADLPPPADDGACDHLAGMRLPSLALPATTGDPIDLAALPGRLVVYCFPRAGQPDVPTPAGWDQIPGARGCTPQSLAFRDHHHKIGALHAAVFGLSTQSPYAQAEIAGRLNLPFPLLSDARLAFARALKLPTFAVEGMTLIKAPDADRHRWSDRESVLSGLSAGPERRRGHRLAARASAAPGTRDRGLTRGGPCLSPTRTLQSTARPPGAQIADSMRTTKPSARKSS